MNINRLLKLGLHLGDRSPVGNVLNKALIIGRRDRFHIINPHLTIKSLRSSTFFLKKIVKKDILFRRLSDVGGSITNRKIVKNKKYPSAIFTVDRPLLLEGDRKRIPTVSLTDVNDPLFYSYYFVPLNYRSISFHKLIS